MRQLQVSGLGFRTRLLASLAAAALLTQPAAAADRRPLDLPAGRLEDALDALAAQTGDQLVFAPELVAGRRVPALAGRYDAEGALERLLAGSGIVAVRAGPRVLVLKRPAALPSGPQPAPEGAAPRPFAGGGTPPPAGGAEPDSEPASRIPDARTVAAVEVTGSHIRGAGPPASPLMVLTGEELQRLGRTTLAEALNSLPQVFGGQSTEGTVATSADTLGTNSTYGTGVNLRGLGASATLVLVNGRRLGGSGVAGEFSDVSNLPAIAVSRVEVLLDGASAIYGSDAVGGVVNVILRRDLEGGEARISAGAGASGSPREAQVGVVFGHGWTSGNALVAYEGYRRGALAAQDRDFAASADLRPFGGADRRLTNAFPGNVVAVNPATGVSGPYFGIPAGQTGVGLTPGDFRAGEINRTSRQDGLDILPDQRRQGVYAAVRQDLGDRLGLLGDVRYGFRAARTHIAPPTATVTVGRANPFFVSPNGAASNQIQYSFAGELPNPVIRATAESLTTSLGGRARLSGGWAADGYLGFAQEIDEARAGGVVNTAILAEALGASADRPETAYRAARDGFFNPYTGVAANPPAVMAAIGSGFTINRARSRVQTANLQADGPVLRLPGEELKLAVGINARRETFSRVGSSYTSTVAPAPQNGVAGTRNVTAAFAEVRAPLAGPENGVPGLHALELSGAVRAERFSDFGRSVDPKVGIAWSPLADLRLRASYGTSFRAPGLHQLLSVQTLSPVGFTLSGVQVTTLALQGGNPGLRPETAETWTAGLDYRPAWSAGTGLSVTWFDTDFQNRIGKPVTENLAGALTDPRFASFVQRVSPATNPDDLARINALLALPIALPAAGLTPPTSYFAIVELRSVNTGQLRVRGLDLRADHELAAFGGRLALRADATRLFSYDQRLTPAAAAVDLAGVATYPAKLRGRVAAEWRSGGFGGGLAVNYVGAFHTLAGARIDDHATVDLQLRLRAPEGPLEGLAADLTVRNLFDKAPPFYDNPFGYGYDPANADVVGRFVRLQLTRSW